MSSLFPVSSASAPSSSPIPSSSPSGNNNNNGNPWSTSGGFGSGAGYFQTIVIGLVAGGVLALAVMSLLYRRHRRRMQHLGHNRIVTQTQRRNRGKLDVDFGKEPELWDAKLGEMKGGQEFKDWQPLSIALPPSQTPGVQLTFLIAMPDPSAPDSDTPVVYDEDLEDLPPVELAVASVSVPTSRSELHDLLPELTKKRLLLQSRGIGN